MLPVLHPLLWNHLRSKVRARSRRQRRRRSRRHVHRMAEAEQRRMRVGAWQYKWHQINITCICISNTDSEEDGVGPHLQVCGGPMHVRNARVETVAMIVCEVKRAARNILIQAHNGVLKINNANYCLRIMPMIWPTPESFSPHPVTYLQCRVSEAQN